MNLLVTGGTGFLGAALVPLLARAGHRLRLLQRSAAPEAEALGADVRRAGLEDAEAVRAALDGVDAVFHLAGQVDFDPAEPARLYELHVQGTRRLLEACVAAGVRRVILASTSGTIAVSKEERVATEADPYPIAAVAGWPYYLSKIFQEKAALRIHRDTGLPVVVLNPSLLLGPGDARLSSTDVVFKFLERRIPAMPTGGLSFVDVRDAARAFAAALERGRPGERYLLGGANLTFRDFFGRLERLSGVAAPRVALPGGLNVAGARLLEKLSGWRGAEAPIDAPSVEMGEHFWYCDSRKAEEALGFSARDPQETLFETVRWLEQHVRARKAPETVAELLRGR
ncbi:NAD-dependent epimerase/dehydratase [Anaeromyxobacter sp. K]|uniref:NAD-dependent epimerase/dehydratase family protein n=1 Tax=Anaeromyxobacter sp. (strain K) TaxID=447217 RepID=UPI00015FA06C|nr:NAD-dependent epimerase/dehydratase family protein [Anaeromyxobacter sp. K]ACG72456.1 NAD-dependent epimerase/dehydratase [Anaeromyxobacter sp. K]